MTKIMFCRLATRIRISPRAIVLAARDQGHKRQENDFQSLTD
jgi:hypothetical protein